MNEPNPYAAPQYASEMPMPQLQPQLVGGLWRHGKLLVMHKMAPLPDRCVKSNEPATRRLVRKLSWHHPAISLTVLVSPLIYIILALILQKKATIQIAMTDRWFAKRRRAMLIGWGMVLASIGMFVGAFAIGDNHGDIAMAAVLLSFPVFLTGAIYGMIAARMVKPKKIDDNYVWLKGVHPSFLESLPPWPYGM